MCRVKKQWKFSPALSDHSMGIKNKKVIKGERPLPFQAQKPFILLLIDFNLYFFSCFVLLFFRLLIMVLRCKKLKFIIFTHL